MTKREGQNYFAGKRALVMGLGLHGGGVATAKWLTKHGARVTATDKRTKEVLASSVRALKGLPVRYVLGEHRHEDFEKHDIVVVNPGVPRESEYLQTATKAGARIENDASLFFRHCDNPVIAVTGTRGKTTTTLWAATLLQKKYHDVRSSGNTPDNAFLKEFERVSGKGTPIVAEMSSWQLEHLVLRHQEMPQMRGVGKATRKAHSYVLTESQGPNNKAGEDFLGDVRAPHVAVITNLYPDHLNRYNGIKDYANAKANIFALQKTDDFLILNHNNFWTAHFLKKKPKALLFFISKKTLPKGLHGLFVKNDALVFRFDGMEQKIFSVKKFIATRGAHNLENLMNAVLAVKLFDPTVVVSERDALRLPTPKMRQEEIYKKGRLTIVNDSCATSPDGTIAAIERFRNTGNIVLIAGGTDKELEFAELAKVITKHIPVDQLIILEGSASTKLQKSFHQQKMSRTLLDIKVLKNLDSCVVEAFRMAKNLLKATGGKAKNSQGSVTILFSPGAASFEKFLHEFDRGEQFNKLVKKYAK